MPRLTSSHAALAGFLASAGVTHFVAVFPANVKMARDWSDRPAAAKAAVFGRLPLQVPLVWWALKVAGNASAAATG